MAGKIAVIADVHGNRSALIAVLEEIDKETDIEHIYCLGDMVGIGYETNEVLSILFSRTDVTMIRGNHEDELIAVLQREEGQSQDGEKVHHEWLAARLDSKFLPKLLALPHVLTVSHSGKNLLFTHYHLDADGQYLPIDEDPTLEKLERFYQGRSVEIVCFGHHHPVHYFSTKAKAYLNPGSLGCSNWPFARYATLSLDDDSIGIELKEVPYDNREFLMGYEKLEVPEKDFILTVFHGNQHLG